MADFQDAYPMLLDLEGRTWSDNAHDNGKETYCGISRVYWPEHPIWARVDMAKFGLKHSNAKAISERLLNDSDAGEIVARFYCDWWYRMRLSELRSQRVAFFLFQAAVNIGIDTVTRWAQMVCAANGVNPGVDGIMGPNTIDAVNTVAESDYLSDAAVFQRYFYLMRVIDSPEQRVNKAGWEKRVRDSFRG